MVRTEVYGHRGMGCSTALRFALYPENSMTAFQKCLESGAEGVEFDVFLTDYGEVVVSHGEEPAGLAYLNLLLYKDGKLSLFPSDLSVENLNVPHTNVVLKAPWTYKDAQTSDAMCREVSQLSESDKAGLMEAYLSEPAGYKRPGTDEFELVPTLEQVFMTFGTKLKYNVELKGTKPRLTFEVMKLLDKYPKLEVMVSTFKWIPPPLPEDSPFAENKDEVDPNDTSVDILAPLVCNQRNVPLGLLYTTTESLPSVDRVLECVAKYKAKFVNVAASFWMRDRPVLGFDAKGERALEHFVKRMHEAGLKVLTYSDSPFDNSRHFHVFVDAKVDVVCVNDVPAFTTFLKSYSSPLT